MSAVDVHRVESEALLRDAIRLVDSLLLPNLPSSLLARHRHKAGSLPTACTSLPAGIAPASQLASSASLPAGRTRPAASESAGTPAAQLPVAPVLSAPHAWHEAQAAAPQPFHQEGARSPPPALQLLTLHQPQHDFPPDLRTSPHAALLSSSNSNAADTGGAVAPLHGDVTQALSGQPALPADHGPGGGSSSSSTTTTTSTRTSTSALAASAQPTAPTGLLAPSGRAGCAAAPAADERVGGGADRHSPEAAPAGSSTAVDAAPVCDPTHACSTDPAADSTPAGGPDLHACSTLEFQAAVGPAAPAPAPAAAAELPWGAAGMSPRESPSARPAGGGDANGTVTGLVSHQSWLIPASQAAAPSVDPQMPPPADAAAAGQAHGGIAWPPLVTAAQPLTAGADPPAPLTAGSTQASPRNSGSGASLPPPQLGAFGSARATSGRLSRFCADAAWDAAQAAGRGGCAPDGGDEAAAPGAVAPQERRRSKAAASPTAPRTARRKSSSCILPSQPVSSFRPSAEQSHRLHHAMQRCDSVASSASSTTSAGDGGSLSAAASSGSGCGGGGESMRRAFSGEAPQVVWGPSAGGFGATAAGATGSADAAHRPLDSATSLQVPLAPGSHPTSPAAVSPRQHASSRHSQQPPSPLVKAANPALSTPGITLWTGNKSRAGVARLGLRLLRASGLSHANLHPEADPYATAKCGGQKFCTASIHRSGDPWWDEFFVFEVAQPAFAILKIKVYDDLRCWRPVFLGQVRIPVKSVVETPQRFSEATWHGLKSRGGHPRGTVQLQIIYLVERVHRPLSVMCATWNVGNAQPPEELSSWLRGAATKEHDIIAIGVQECSYREGSAAKEPGACEEEEARLGLRGGMTMESDTSARLPPCHRDSLAPSARASSSANPLRSVHSISNKTLGSDGVELEGSTGAENGSAGELFARMFQPLGTAPRVSVAFGPDPTTGSVAALANTVDMSYSSQMNMSNLGSPQTRKHGRILRKLEAGAGGGKFRDLLEDHLRGALGDQSYWLARSVHMGQIRLLVFVRNDVFPAVTVLGKASQATGVGGVATNKGGVAVAIRVWDTEICFINSHLAAHQDKVKSRNSQYREIVRGLRFEPQGKHQPRMDVLTAYHHVFWMGDLNYRLDYGLQATAPSLSPTATDFAALVADMQAGRYRELLAVDQLRATMAAQQAFLGFQEPDVSFPATFKVRRVRGMEWDAHRSPAWCDRVLFRSNLPLKQARPTDYFAATDIASSDHKPVAAVFSVPTVWQSAADERAGSLQVVLSDLSARGLFLLRDKRRVTHLPSPQVVIGGACLKGKPHTTSVCIATREPAWGGEIVLPLHTTAMQELTHYRLLVCLLDHPAGSQLLGFQGFRDLDPSTHPPLHAYRLLVCLLDHPAGLSSRVHTLARCVLPLADAATRWMMHHSSAQSVVPFSVALEYNGLPAGVLEGKMRIVVEDPEGLAGQGHPTRGLLNRISLMGWKST